MSGYYQEAIRQAAQAYEHEIQTLCLDADRSGRELMGLSFGGKDPVVPLGDLSTQLGRSQQEGMMHLSIGVMLAIRNKYSHGPKRDVDEETAREELCTISLLFNLNYS